MRCTRRAHAPKAHVPSSSGSLAFCARHACTSPPRWCPSAPAPMQRADRRGDRTESEGARGSAHVATWCPGGWGLISAAFVFYRRLRAWRCANRVLASEAATRPAVCRRCVQAGWSNHKIHHCKAPGLIVSCQGTMFTAAVEYDTCTTRVTPASVRRSAARQPPRRSSEPAPPGAGCCAARRPPRRS